MKFKITYLALFTFALNAIAQNQLESLHFLEGVWKMENKENYEQWTLTDHGTLEAQSYTIQSGIKRVNELLEIISKGNQVTYLATVFSQNDGQSIAFPLNTTLKDKFSFENPNHDFPQKISYQPLNENEIFVEVLGGDGKGFSYKIVRSEEPRVIPQWFVEDMKNNIGTWIADNSAYLSENEPYTAYGMEWKWGIGHTSIKGRLFALKDGKEFADFWQFRQYWDNENGEAVIEQFGYNGVTGIGHMQPREDGYIESIQTFSMPNGKAWKERHLTKTETDHFLSTAFEPDGDNWVEKRTYKWIKEVKDQIDLGEFSISLSVKDIYASKLFYENLGFTIENGKVEDNWILMKNGDTKIGLFQDILTNNTLTFDTKNARPIFRKYVDGKLETLSQDGLDQPKGKASFIITDPDGNTILFDQYQ